MTFAGIVPAAGASRRMGTSKALLRLGDETFLERVVRALADGGCAPVVVVVAESDDEAADVARAAGARVLSNPDPGEGPITSLRLALEALGDDLEGAAYLPLDHPLVGADVVARLIDEASKSGAALTLPRHGGKRGHPALFRRSLFAELLDPRLDGGARIVVHEHLDGACIVDMDDAAVVTDVDTPAAYAEVLRVLAEREGA